MEVDFLERQEGVVLVVRLDRWDREWGLLSKIFLVVFAKSPEMEVLSFVASLLYFF